MNQKLYLLGEWRRQWGMIQVCISLSKIVLFVYILTFCMPLGRVYSIFLEKLRFPEWILDVKLSFGFMIRDTLRARPPLYGCKYNFKVAACGLLSFLLFSSLPYPSALHNSNVAHKIVWAREWGNFPKEEQCQQVPFQYFAAAVCCFEEPC